MVNFTQYNYEEIAKKTRIYFTSLPSCILRSIPSCFRTSTGYALSAGRERSTPGRTFT